MKDIIAKLNVHGTKFQTSVLGYPKTLQISITEIQNQDDIISVCEEGVFGTSMNVEKFTPTAIKLYSYSIFGKKITHTLKYSNIEFVEE